MNFRRIRNPSLRKCIFSDYIEEDGIRVGIEICFMDGEEICYREHLGDIDYVGPVTDWIIRGKYTPLITRMNQGKI